MGNLLDGAFDAGLPAIPYALTLTDFNVAPPEPTVHYATGVLRLGKEPGLVHWYLDAKRYIDSNLYFWQGKGMGFKPPSMIGGGWANVLEIFRTPSGFVFKYHDKTNPVASYSAPITVLPSVGFPGFPQARSVICTAPSWLGLFTLVLGLPDNFEAPHKDFKELIKDRPSLDASGA